MDPETWHGLPSTGQKARLLTGTACWFWNSIGPNFSSCCKVTSMNVSPVAMKSLLQLVFGREERTDKG